jgi:tetratricopeptide (TPR) repeat protein
MRDPSGKFNSTNALGLGIFASFLTVSVFWYLLSLNKDTLRNIDYGDSLKEEEEILDEVTTGTAKAASTSSAAASTKKTDASAEKAKDSKANDDADSAKASARKKVHAQVEDADKRGKTLFKAKNYLEAAECFSEALDLIEASGDSSLSKQVVTLLNNRSAMYEKGSLAELALVDCDAILEQDVTHSKARLRKMRVLESMERYHDALVEVCAIQLRCVLVSLPLLFDR